MNNQNVQTLLQTKMSRKEFILFGVTAIITFTGVTQIGSTLHNILAKKNNKLITNSPGGFSNGPYGGSKS